MVGPNFFGRGYPSFVSSLTKLDTMKYLLTVLALVMSSVVFPQAECPNAYDGNGDGVVTISDLLDLLGLFGDADTDQDGVWDSVDECGRHCMQLRFGPD